VIGQGDRALDDVGQLAHVAGQSWRASHRIASSVMPDRPGAAAGGPREQRVDQPGISRASRSGGISIGSRLSRKNRRGGTGGLDRVVDSRGGRCDHARVDPVSAPPTGRTRDDSRTWSSLLWISSGISATSSRKIVPPEPRRTGPRATRAHR